MTSSNWFPLRSARQQFSRLVPAAALVAALLAGGGSALAAPVSDVVNVPGLNSTMKLIPMAPGSGYTRRQTFKAQQTGNLVGVWIAAACDNCGDGLNDFVNILVRDQTGSGILEVPPLSEWVGGNSGNLQYVDLSNAGSLAVKAGDTVEIDFACAPSSTVCLSSFKLVTTGDQYANGMLSDTSAGGSAGVSLNADLVFISQMDNIVAPAPVHPPTPEQTAPQTTIRTANDTDASIQYTGGGWGYYAGRGVHDIGDDVHATLNNGDSVTYTFTGTGISYVTEKSVDEGTVDVAIDGVFQSTVNAQSGDHNLANQTVYNLWGLPVGRHTITLTKRSGTYMLLDAFLVQTAGQTINDTQAGLQYSGTGWGYYAGRPASVGDLQQDVHATLVDGDSVSYTFSGTGISYTSEKSVDEGKVDVYLDGVLQQTVDAYAAGIHNQGGQVLFAKLGLTAGQHTLKLIKHGGTYMLLDAITVLP